MTFLRFAFQRYYPRGGFDDLAGVFDTIDAAKAAPIDEGTATVQIVDVSQNPPVLVATGCVVDPWAPTLHVEWE